MSNATFLSDAMASDNDLELLVGTNAEGSTAEYLRSRGIPVEVLHLGILAHNRSLLTQVSRAAEITLGVRRWIVERRLDLIHTDYEFLTLVAAAGRLSVPVTATVRAFPEGKFRSRFKPLLASRLIALTPTIALAVGSSASVVTIPNSLTTEFLQAAAAVRERARQRDEREREYVVVGLVGAVSPDKRWLQFAEEVAPSISEGVKFVHFGGIEDDNYLEQTLTAFGASGVDYTYHGFVDWGAQLYAGFDVVALPSRVEGIPRAVLEGKACGVPAIIRDFKGAEYAVDAGVDGLIADSWKQMRALINRFAVDQDMRRSLTDGALQRGLELPTNRDVAHTIVSEWQSLVTARRDG